MKHVIYDTNIVLELTHFDVFHAAEQAIDDHVQHYVMESTYNELKRLEQKGNGRRSRAAKLARTVLTQKDIKTRSSSTTYTDDDIVNATKNDAKQFIVATNDEGLIKRLRTHGVTVLKPRQRSHFIYG